MRADVPAAAPPPIVRGPKRPMKPADAGAGAAPAPAQPGPGAAPPPPLAAPRADDGPYEVSPAGTKWRQSIRPRGRGADFDNAREYFTAPDMDGWMLRMRADPGIFTHLLSDIFRETRAETERMAGQAKIGRRPKVIEGSLSELWEMVTPRYAVEPFPDALKALVGAVSPAEFQHKTMIAPDTFRKMLRGEALDMWRVEVVARAYSVSPAYFREWRHDFVLTVVEELLAAQPNLSIRYAKFLARVADEGGKRKTRRKAPIAAM
jgi:hypothetical protein